MIYILTKNYRQYSQFLREIHFKAIDDRRYRNLHSLENGKDIRYIEDDRSIRGSKKSTIYKSG